MVPTHRFTGKACLGTMENITSTASGRSFDNEKVFYLATKLFNVYFMDDKNKIWITDTDRWEDLAEELEDENEDSNN